MNNEELDRQLVKDLKGAVEALELHGWTQGNYTDGKGRVCVVGAIRTAVWGHPNFEPGASSVSHARVNEAEFEFVEAVGDEAAEFNDTEGRKKKEIIRGLRQARRNVKARLA